MKKSMYSVLMFFLFLLASVINLHAQSSQGSEYVRIINTFNAWKVKQFKNGNYADEKHCNADTVIKEGYKGPEMGIPKEIDVSFCDINHDEKIDALITFFVDQCDGGNALMNLQIQLLVLSKNDSYYVDDKYFERISKSLKRGWIIVEDASDGTINGIFYDYKESDGRCCPSVKKPFEISYPTSKLNYK